MLQYCNINTISFNTLHCEITYVLILQNSKILQENIARISSMRRIPHNNQQIIFKRAKKMAKEINKVNLIDGRESSHLKYQGITEKGKDVEDDTTLSYLHDDVLITKYVSTCLEVKIQDIVNKEIRDLYDTFCLEGAIKE